MNTGITIHTHTTVHTHVCTVPESCQHYVQKLRKVMEGNKKHSLQHLAHVAVSKQMQEVQNTSHGISSCCFVVFPKTQELRKSTVHMLMHSNVYMFMYL